MKIRSIVLVALMLIAPWSAANDSAELKRITNELLAAIAPGDVAVWQKYAHERLPDDRHLAEDEGRLAAHRCATSAARSPASMTSAKGTTSSGARF